MTGLAWVAEQGLISAPLCITNTYSVGLVRDAICALAVRDNAPQPWHLPVAAETCDGWLSDSASFPVTVDLALAALDDAKGGPVAEGNVGGGTGMICRSSRAAPAPPRGSCGWMGPNTRSTRRCRPTTAPASC